MDFTSFGLFILRVGFGATMAIRHGLPSLLDFANRMNAYPDPLGIGSTASLTLMVFAEFFCAVLLVVGLFTRWAAIPLVIAMAVAFFVVQGSDPFAKKEMAFLYLLAFSSILAAGPGRYSADTFFRGVR